MSGRILTILFILIGLILSILAYGWLAKRVLSQDSQQPNLEIKEVEDTIISRPVLLFGLMLAGIVASAVYDHMKELQSKKSRFKLSKLLASFGDNPRLWMAICVSPLVFFVTYQAIAQLPDDTVAMLYAFQNGFFWESIFGGLRR
jgi:hypothetical protein